MCKNGIKQGAPMFMRMFTVLVASLIPFALHAAPPGPQYVIRLGSISNESVQDPKLMSNLDTYDCKYIDNLRDQNPQNPTLFKVPGCSDANDIKGICRGIIRCAKDGAPLLYLHSECVTKSNKVCPNEHECMRTSYYDSSGISILSQIKASPGENGNLNVEADQIFQQGASSGGVQ